MEGISWRRCRTAPFRLFDQSVAARSGDAGAPGRGCQVDFTGKMDFMANIDSLSEEDLCGMVRMLPSIAHSGFARVQTAGTPLSYEASSSQVADVEKRTPVLFKMLTAACHSSQIRQAAPVL